MRTPKNIIRFLLVALLCCVTNSATAKVVSRVDIINQELNQFSKLTKNETKKVRVKKVKKKKAPKKIKPKRIKKKKLSFKTKANDSLHMQNKKLQCEIGVQRHFHRYAEPNLMKIKDYMHGMSGAITYTFQENEHPDVHRNRKYYNKLLRLDGEYNYGLLDYDSEGTGESQNDRYDQFEIRGVAGLDIVNTDTFAISNYAGIGYRRLKDNGGGTQTSTGHYSYDRKSNYVFSPIGIDIYKKLTKSLAIKFNAEYDYFFGGKQVSHLEDVHPAYTTLTNDQNDGYGARGSIRLIKEQKNVSFYIEPFVRYWEIKDSEVSSYNVGAAVGYGLEPLNNTTEYGFRLGAIF